MLEELIPQLFEVCIIPLLGILTTFAVKFINAKIEEISANKKNETEKKYLDMLNSTITDCVIASSNM
jgi:hypothetical protein